MDVTRYIRIRGACEHNLKNINLDIPKDKLVVLTWISGSGKSSPAISISQKSGNRNPRSTVRTVTEIYDYFRLLYARAGIPHCPECGRKVSKQSVDQIVDHLLIAASAFNFILSTQIISIIV